MTLGSQSFGGQTSTGLLSGTSQVVALAPAGHEYVVSLPAASTAMLTLTPTR